MRDVRVLHVVKGLGRGGAEAVVHSLASQSLDASIQHEVLLAMSEPRAMVQDFRDGNVPLHEAALSSLHQLPALGWRIRRIVNERSIDIIHDHFPLTGALGRFWRFLHHAKLIYTEHSMPWMYHSATRSLHLATLTRANAVVAVSAEIKGWLKTKVNTGRAVTAIQNGIDTNSFVRRLDRTYAKKRIGIPEGCPVVGAVLNMRKEKRLDRWIRVARRVADEIPEVRFLLVGGGLMFDEAVSLASSVALLDQIVFTGPQSDPRPYLEAFDVNLLTSDVEGLPIALLEAMSMGVYSVAPKVGGLGMITHHGVGAVTPPGDEEGLVYAVVSALRRIQELQDLETHIRSVAQTQFSVEMMIEQYHRLYREVLGGP